MADESWWDRTKEAAIAAWDRLVFETQFPTAEAREERALLMDVRKGMAPPSESWKLYEKEVSGGRDMEQAWQDHKQRVEAWTRPPTEEVVAKPAPEPEPDWEKISNQMFEDKVTRNYVAFEHKDAEGRLDRDPAEGPAKSIIEYADDVETVRRDIYAERGEVIAQSTHHSIRDEEHYSYEEQWINKDGQTHRDGDKPAVTIWKEHFIPDETYLDESRQEIWKSGVEISSTDTTWDDIVSRKGLTPDSLRQMGYDPEEPIGPKQAPTWSEEYEQNTGMTPVRPPMKLEAPDYVEDGRTMDANYQPPSLTPRIADGRQREIGLGL